MNGKTKAWRCTVCGYIHRDQEPPDVCPVCGAGSEAFEIYTMPATEPLQQVQLWKCLNCTYIHKGTTSPDTCPVCGAPRERFEPLLDEASPLTHTDRKDVVVVIGGGVAGVSAAESVRHSAPEAELIMVSKEDELPYFRLNLTRFLAGELSLDVLPLHQVTWYTENRIELLTGEEATNLDVQSRVVTLRSGKRLGYDQLVLAMGSHSFVPPIGGVHKQGVYTFRTVKDAQALLKQASQGGPCVCIGGGVLGIETAGAIARRGGDVTLLESHEWLMPRQLNQLGGEMLAEHMRGMGIKMRFGARTREILGDECVGGVQFEDETIIPAEHVIFATGVRPNSYLARLAGLEVNRGVVVNNRMETSCPGVFAAGDLAEHHGNVYGLWSASQFQGSISGLNVCGIWTDFGGLPRSNSLKVLGVDLLSVGQFQPEDGSYLVFEYTNEGKYYRFVFQDGMLVGSILFGDTFFGAAVQKAVEKREDFSGVLAGKPTGRDIVEHFLP